MSTDPCSQHAAIEPFLVTLTAAGLPVGVSERLRIAQVLALEGAWSLARVRDAFRAVIARSEDDVAIFDRVFAEHFDVSVNIDVPISRRLDLDTALKELDQLHRAVRTPALWPLGTAFRGARPASTPSSADDAEATPRHSPQWRVLILAIGAFLFVAGLLQGDVVFQSEVPTLITDDGVIAEDAQMARRPVDAGSERDMGEAIAHVPSPAPQDTGRFDLIRIFDFQLTSPPPQLDAWPVWLALAGCVLGVLIGYGVYVQRARRIVLPDEISRTALSGPRLFVPKSLRDAPAWLPSILIDELADNLGYYRSEETDDTIDVRRSVEATCRRGGIPLLVPLRRRQVRRVVILSDEETPALKWNCVPNELADGLACRGAIVITGTFRGLPQQLRFDDGTNLTLEDLDEARAGLILLIFGAGRVPSSPEETQTLEDLGRWERVAWFDPRDIAHHDRGTEHVARYVPVFPTSASGIIAAIRLLCSERSGSFSWNASPLAWGTEILVGRASVSPVVDGPHLEATLGDALPWAAACAMLQPMPISWAQHLRATLFATVSPERLDRLLALPETRRSIYGFHYADRVKKNLLADFRVRFHPEREREVRRKLIELIDAQEPPEANSRQHLAWLWRRVRVFFELNTPRALETLVKLRRSPLGAAVQEEMSKFDGKLPKPGEPPPELLITSELDDKEMALLTACGVRTGRTVPNQLPIRRRQWAWMGTAALAFVALLAVGLWGYMPTPLDGSLWKLEPLESLSFSTGQLCFFKAETADAPCPGPTCSSDCTLWSAPGVLQGEIDLRGTTSAAIQIGGMTTHTSLNTPASTEPRTLVLRLAESIEEQACIRDLSSAVQVRRCVGHRQAVTSWRRAVEELPVKIRQQVVDRVASYAVILLPRPTDPPLIAKATALASRLLETHSVDAVVTVGLPSVEANIETDAVAFDWLSATSGDPRYIQVVAIDAAGQASAARWPRLNGWLQALPNVERVQSPQAKNQIAAWMQELTTALEAADLPYRWGLGADDKASPSTANQVLLLRRRQGVGVVYIELWHHSRGPLFQENVPCVIRSEDDDDTENCWSWRDCVLHLGRWHVTCVTPTGLAVTQEPVEVVEGGNDPIRLIAPHDDIEEQPPPKHDRSTLETPPPNEQNRRAAHRAEEDRLRPVSTKPPTISIATTSRPPISPIPTRDWDGSQRLRITVDSGMNPQCGPVCANGFAKRLGGELKRRLGIEMLNAQDDPRAEDLVLEIYLFRECGPSPGLSMVYRFSPALPKGSVYSVHLRDFLVREELKDTLTSRLTVNTAARNIEDHFPYLVRVTTERSPNASIWNVVWSKASVVREGDCMVRANADPTLSEISENNHDTKSDSQNTESCAFKLSRKKMALVPAQGRFPQSNTLFMKSEIYKASQPVKVSVKIRPLARDTAIHPPRPIPKVKIKVSDEKTRVFYSDEKGWVKFARLPLERMVELEVKDTDPKRRFEGKLRWRTALPFESRTVEIPVEIRPSQVRYVLRFYPPPLPEQIGAPGGRVLGVVYVAENAAPNVYHSEGGKPYLNPPQKDPLVRVSAAHLLKKFYDAMDPLPDGSDAYFRVEAFDLPLSWNVPGTSRRTLPHSFKIQVRSLKEVAFLDVAVARDLTDRIKAIRSLSMESLRRLEFSGGEAYEILRDARQLVGPRGALRWHPQLVQVAHAMGQRALTLGQSIPEPRDAREFYDAMIEALSVPVLGKTDEYGPIPKPIPYIEPADGPYVIYYPKYGEVYSKIFVRTLSRNDPSDVRRKRVRRFYDHIDPLLDIENSQNAPYHLMAVAVMTQVLDVAFWNRIDDVNEQTMSEREKRGEEDIKQLAARIELRLSSARSFVEGSETLKTQYADSRRMFRELLQDIVTKAQKTSGEVVIMAGEWGPKNDESRSAIEELDKPIQFDANLDGPVADVLGKLMQILTSRKRLMTLLYQARHKELAAIVSTYPKIEVPQVFAKKRSQFEKIKRALKAAERAAELFFQHEKALGHLRDGYREWEDFERDLHTRIRDAVDSSSTCVHTFGGQLESLASIAHTLDSGYFDKWRARCDKMVSKWEEIIETARRTLPIRAQYVRGNLSDGHSQAVRFENFAPRTHAILQCKTQYAADVETLKKELKGIVQSTVEEIREIINKLKDWNKRASKHEKVKIPHLPIPRPDYKLEQAAQTADASWKKARELWDKARLRTKQVCEQLGEHFDLMDKCVQRYADQFQPPKRLADIESQLERGEILAAWGRCKHHELQALGNLGLCFDRLKSNVGTLTVDSDRWQTELKQVNADWKNKQARAAIEALLKIVVEDAPQ